MKYQRFLSNLGTLTAFALFAIFGTPCLRAVVTFTVSPTNVDSAYAGQITLQVTGLNAGQAVLVQKFVDYNGNGAVDANEPAVQTFTLTDNAAVVIGGVTNTSVPGDFNPASGAITTTLNAVNNGLLPNFSGKFVFELSSPNNAFTPKYQSFWVTSVSNTQYGTITGKVSYNGTGLSNAAVVVLTPSSPGGGNASVGGAVADSSGNFSVKVLPGAYVVLGFVSNYVYNLNNSPSFTVTSGGTVTQNVTLMPATETISGRIYDTNSNAGFPGYFIAGESENGYFSGGVYTDANGNYSLPIVSGIWKLVSNERELGQLGYLAIQNKPKAYATNGSISGFNIGFMKANAMLYGRVVDNLGNPVPNVDLGAGDGYGNYESEALTDINGWYFLGASSEYPANWYVQLETPLIPALQYYDFTSSNMGTNLSANQALRQDIAAIAAPYTITGSVLNVSNAPLAGVEVDGSATINNVTYQPVPGNADSNGMYVLYVAGNASWSVSVSCQNGGQTLGNLGYNCADTETVNIGSGNGTANFWAPAPGTDELDGNVTDGSGNGISGVTVYAVCTQNNQTNQISTDANGFFEFIVPDNSAWNLSLDCSNLTAKGFNCVSEMDGINVGIGQNSSGNNFSVQSSVPPFFTGEASLGNNVYYLATDSIHIFGYFSTLYFPYIYHYDMGWEYYIDAGNGAHGAYFYDFTDGVFFYTEPGVFPYIYDFRIGHWLYYDPSGTAGHYTSNPRWFYDLTAQVWINDL